MSRLIDADRLKAHYSWWKGGTREMTMDEAKSDFDTIIDLQPTVDPIKHGRWVIEPGATIMHCDICSWAFEYYGGLEEEWNNCPHCGAKMDAQIGEDKSHPFAESVMMGMDGGENESSR